MLKNRIPWNEAGARAEAKSRGKVAAAKLAAAVKKRRSIAARKHKTGRA